MNEEFVEFMCDSLDGKSMQDCIKLVVDTMKISVNLHVKDDDKLKMCLHVLADLIATLSVIQTTTYLSNMERIDDEMKVLRNAISVLQDNA